MVRTPWGEVGASNGRGKREQLLAAMVASCAERGFEATTVADLLELSSASRASFYEHFENKHDCFEAMLAETAKQTMGTVEHRLAATDPGVARVEATLAVFAELIAAQPETARACLIDAFAAGPRARRTMEAAVADLETVLAGALAEVDGRAAMPEGLTRGLAGAVYKVFQSRVARGESAAVAEMAPQLTAWLLDQQPPPRPLRPGRRVAVLSPFSPAFSRHDPVGRILRAVASCVAKRGYAETTIAEIAGAAQVSLRTFYEHFAGKEEATIAALDASGAQMLAAAMPAIRRAPDWPSAVRDAYAAMCGFMAAEPDFARLRVVEVYAAGAAALEMRDRVGAELLEALLASAPEAVVAEAEPLRQEAIAGAIYALSYYCVRERGPEELPRIVPFATYLALAPFIGPEQACEVANGDGGRRARGI